MSGAPCADAAGAAQDEVARLKELVDAWRDSRRNHYYGDRCPFFPQVVALRAELQARGVTSDGLERINSPRAAFVETFAGVDDTFAGVRDIIDLIPQDAAGTVGGATGDAAQLRAVGASGERGAAARRDDGPPAVSHLDMLLGRIGQVQFDIANRQRSFVWLPVGMEAEQDAEVRGMRDRIERWCKGESDEFRMCVRLQQELADRIVPQPEQERLRGIDAERLQLRRDVKQLRAQLAAARGADGAAAGSGAAGARVVQEWRAAAGDRARRELSDVRAVAAADLAAGGCPSMEIPFDVHVPERAASRGGDGAPPTDVGLEGDARVAAARVDHLSAQLDAAARAALFIGRPVRVRGRRGVVSQHGGRVSMVSGPG
eukprot:gene36829-40844_t